MANSKFNVTIKKHGDKDEYTMKIANDKFHVIVPPLTKEQLEAISNEIKKW